MSSLFPEPATEALTISQLNEAVNVLLQDQIPPLWVEGELTGWKPYPSGHIYFGLKEGDEARVDAVMWKSFALRLPAGVKFEAGIAVFAFGTVNIYSPRGQFQFVVQRMFPKGLSAAEESLRKLREKLLAQGYFAPQRKRLMPQFPCRIAVVTSGKGAAVRDILEIFCRHWPLCDAVVVSVRVQGEQASMEIAAALDRLNELHTSGYLPLDAIIVGRGGGSAEDLAAFDREEVADAIFRSAVPVISAVGHEIDITIADQVADLRATTPTNAAEILTRGWAGVPKSLLGFRQAMAAGLSKYHQRARDRLDGIASRRVFRQPLERLRLREQRLDELAQRQTAAMRRLLRTRTDRLDAVAGRLNALSPLNVLARGYSLTLNESGQLIRSASQVAAGERIETRLAAGRLTSVVENVQAEKAQ